MPHGPSYRAYPRLYHRVILLLRSKSVAFGAKQTLTSVTELKYMP